MLLAVITAAAILTIGFGNSYHTLVMTNLIVTLILTLSLNLIVGDLGLLSFSHGVFFGVGAYISGILSTRLGVDPWICLPIAMLVVLLLGVLLAGPIARLRGIYFAVASLAFATFFEILVRELPSITRGAYGLAGIPALTIGGREIAGSSMLLLHCVVLVIVVVLLANLKNSRLGREFGAVRDNEVAAAASGISISTVRIAGFLVAAVVAALAGWLYAFSARVLAPDIMALDRTFFWFFIVLIGGAGSIYGVVAATVILVLAPQALNFASSQQVLMSGLIMLVVVLFAPKGISGLFETIAIRRRGQS